MRKRFAPLTVTEVDPVLDFIDRALTRLGLSTASRLPLLAAAESAPAAQEAFLKVAGEYAQIELNFTELAYVSSAGLRLKMPLKPVISKTSIIAGLTWVRTRLPPVLFTCF